MRTLFFILIIPALALFLESCSEHQASKNEYPEFTVTTLVPIDTTSFTEYSAEIHAIQNVELRAKVSGYLDEIHVDEGQFVKQGQLLFSLNDLEYKEELAKVTALYKNALADLGNAEINLKSAKRLVEKNVISKSELEIASNKVEAAKAKVEEAKAEEATALLKQAYTKIKAPFSGKINRIPYKMGSLIEEGTLLTTISQDNEVFAYFNISEKEYLNYAFNLKNDSVHSKEVQLILANGREHSSKGIIETIESEIDKNTGNIAFRARFKNPENLLKHGASGKIRLRKDFNKVLVIPQKSTFEIQDKMYVYVLDKTNSVQVRNVTVSGSLPHLYIINSGLQAGDKIVYEGIQNLKEDLKISVRIIPFTELLKNLAIK